MNRSVLRLGLVVLCAVCWLWRPVRSSLRSTTQTLSGSVVDATGAVIPGADVAAKHNGTGVVSNAVSNAEGLFSIPSLPIGTYTVTVTLQGFKTVVVNDVVLTSGAGASVKATMEVGGVTEQVTVASSSEIVQTQSSTVSPTINTNADHASCRSPPAARWTSSTSCRACRRRPATATRSINGLPRGTINITLDGVNVQDNTLRIDRRLLRHRQPASRRDRRGHGDDGVAGRRRLRPGRGAGEVRDPQPAPTSSPAAATTSTAATSSTPTPGSTTATASPRPKLKQNQIGGRAGGPIVIPGLFDGHNKAFFFVNYEELRQPSDTTRNRTMLNPAAQAGNFTLSARRLRSTCCSSRPPTARSRRSIRPSASCSQTSARRWPAARSTTSTPTCSASRSTCRSRRSAATRRSGSTTT